MGKPVITRQHFLNVFKQSSIHMPLEQQADMMDYLQLDCAPNMVNLTMMNKLFQIVAKIQFNKLRNQENMITPSASQVQQFVKTLSSKLRLAFRDSD